MLKLKPYSHLAEITYQKSSSSEMTIQVSSGGVKKRIIASVFPREAVKEIQEVNARSCALEKTG